MGKITIDMVSEQDFLDAQKLWELTNPTKSWFDVERQGKINLAYFAQCLRREMKNGQYRIARSNNTEDPG